MYPCDLKDYPYRKVRIVMDPESYPGLVYFPPEIANSERPLLIYLHGAGEVGDDLDLLVGDGATGTPIRDIEKDEAMPELLEFVVAAPQAKKNFEPGLVEKFVDFILFCFPNINPRHVYVTGNSMGGAGALNAAAKTKIFAACAPVAPAGAPASEFVKHVPVWAFHGKNDKVVDSSISEKLITGLRRLGVPSDDAKITLYDNAPTPPEWPNCQGHAASIPTYKSPALFAWLLSKKLPAHYLDDDDDPRATPPPGARR